MGQHKRTSRSEAEQKAWENKKLEYKGEKVNKRGNQTYFWVSKVAGDKVGRTFKKRTSRANGSVQEMDSGVSSNHHKREVL